MGSNDLCTIDQILWHACHGLHCKSKQKVQLNVNVNNLGLGLGIWLGMANF